MNFAGFTLYSSWDRKPPAAPEELRLIGEIFESCNLLAHLPPYNDLNIAVNNPVPADASMLIAHGMSADLFAKWETPPGLPRQPIDSTCPPGIVRVSIECREQSIPGMGHYYGYSGHFLSLLVCLSERCIWDVRGERTD